MRGGRPMRRIRVMGLLPLVTLSIMVFDAAQATDAPVQFNNVRVSELPQGVTVMLETSGPTRYQATVFESPTRFVIDMHGTYAAPKRRWMPTVEPIKEIRG